MRKRRYKKIYRAKKKRPMFLRPYFWAVFIFLFLAGGGFYSALFSSFFQIHEIVITGNSKITTEELSNIIREQVSKKIAAFDTKSIFLADLKEIDRQIREKVPQIYNVYLRRGFPGIIYAQIEERQPLGIWCRGQECFILDKDGIIFEKSGAEGALVIKSEESGKNISLGQEVVSPEMLAAILAIREKIGTDYTFGIKAFVISDNAEKLFIETKEGWTIYFNTNKEIDGQLTNLDLVLKTQIPPEKRGNLLYIDLRFGNKVYFKYRE